MVEPESKHRNSIMRQHILAVGLIMEFPNIQLHHQTLETNMVKVHSKTIPITANTARIRCYIMERHQTLKFTHGESTSQDNSNKHKHD
ncbi:hypothetical protein EVAR_100427_1 [Eumeta japonica]|uniref:Uncharacterized protein n=1 Tax=Eumeta variegata TaxID=151549 RepID=A0A4C2A9S1_EUMVA|nr:hypothetical protein EVAR_100427_1 [Eumeta japonica]